MGAMPYEHRNASKKSKSLTSIFPCDAQRRAYHGAQVVADLFTMRLHLVHLRHELQQPLSRRIAFELIVFSLEVRTGGVTKQLDGEAMEKWRIYNY